MVFNQDKVLIVLHWEGVQSSYQFAGQVVEPIIAEMRKGVILNEDDIINHSSNLYISRHFWDCHGALYIEQTKMTSEAAIIGPISNLDDNFWNCWYTEALIAAGFKNFICYICDFSKLSNKKDEIRLYLSNCHSYTQGKLPVLCDFQLSVIPVVYEKLSHAIPDFMKRRAFINYDNLEIKSVLEVCKVTKVEDGLQVNVSMSEVDERKEFIIQTNKDEYNQ